MICLTTLQKEKAYIDIYGLKKYITLKFNRKFLTSSGDIHQTSGGSDFSRNKSQYIFKFRLHIFEITLKMKTKH